MQETRAEIAAQQKGHLFQREHRASSSGSGTIPEQEDSERDEASLHSYSVLWGPITKLLSELFLD
jgi:hypothetical protein